MEQYGYFGIFLLIALENVFPPIPSEVILTFGGFMTTYTSLTPAGVILASTLGSILGAVILYGIGLLVNVDRLEGWVERYGRFLRLKKEDIRRADAWFDRYGYWTVLFCRMIPLIRSLISVPAGMAKMKFGLFLLFTTVGTLIWNVTLVLVGAAVGGNWGKIVAFMDVYSHIAYGVIAAAAAAVLVFWLRKRRGGGARRTPEKSAD
ncbi:DedA family protein [Paenibacillus macerans]|nr:DedA family protein [Paenibacillus macerans]MBS5912281.1 DedA family protein [Paenibacillus macerans]MCY7557897.1 DedA family protein [Paenibacillus macerans]MDU5947182.1 DedA family protein [Paenibacillus macerans]MEC0140667.1 DedA family protein [Paenibacillus macerans]MEC0150983.1 DedA family protein [Paenibacillus macerans]